MQIINSNLTYSDYLELTIKYLSENPNERPGQAAFNVLFIYRPDLSEQVRGLHLDPFYEKKRLPAFHKWLKENW